MNKDHYLAVDPGIRYPAAAIFDGKKTLVKASRVKLPAALSRLPMGMRCLEIGKLIVKWTGEYHTRIGGYCFEYPQIYVAKRSKGDPNNLTPLVGVGMVVAAYFDVPTKSPYPVEVWGQVPKNEECDDPWGSPRGQKIKRRLTQAEIACVDASHDSVDAIGIGLWALGRFERIRVFHGAV